MRENYLLDSRLLDCKDDEANLDVIEGFYRNMGNTRADLENINFYIDDKVKDFIRELKNNIVDANGVTDRHDNERIVE